MEVFVLQILFKAGLQKVCFCKLQDFGCTPEKQMLFLRFFCANKAKHPGAC